MFRLVVRAAILLALTAFLYLLFFLQEWQVFGNSFVRSAAVAGVKLPMAAEDVRLVIDVSDRTMSVFSGETVIKRYDVATGPSRPGMLGREGSTPLGDYLVMRKHVRTDVFERGSRFLEIDYPSFTDVELMYESGSLSDDEYERCLDAYESGAPMPRDLPCGAGLGIQGNYFAFRGQSFTDGSIAMGNAEINELFDFVPIGALVSIQR